MAQIDESSKSEGYRGVSLSLLREFDAQVWDLVTIKTKDGFETTGLILPRYEHAVTDHIVLKLKSGYNFGISVSSIESITVKARQERTEATVVRQTEKTAESQGKVLLLSTGGTIASRVDYRTGAVHPALSAEDLYSTVPELKTIASIHPEVLFSTYSENLTPDHWQKISEAILEKKSGSRIDGIVLMLGTDTMAYVSAALSFSLIGLGIPVVCVGAQRSTDRPSSDAALNLIAATRFAADSKQKGVFVAMHENENDDTIAIHLGVRVRKNHTSRRDAFKSIDVSPFSLVRKGTIFPSDVAPSGIFDPEFQLKLKFEPNVALLKFYPGFEFSVLDHLVERGIKGLIIEGSGLGHVSDVTVRKISEITRKGVFVGICSQCIWGRVDLNVYETGRDLILAGAVPLENMISETALAKLSWAYGNFPKNRIREVMLRNLVREFTERISL